MPDTDKPLEKESKSTTKSKATKATKNESKAETKDSTKSKTTKAKDTEKTKATKPKAKSSTKKTKAKKNLVIVESPAKAKTLVKFLGSNYKVVASLGHVRDLPKSDLGVDIDNDFEPRYITIRGKGDILKSLRSEVKNAKTVYLATDPDREGEAISWHLSNALNLEEKGYKRITFNEITKEAVKNSIENATDINYDLVNAQQARRALDRVVGYKLSPILWAKIKRGLSAGRVQSVTLSLINDREEEIASFVPSEFWTIHGDVTKNRKKATFNLVSIKNEKIEINNEEEANEIHKKLKKANFSITQINESEKVRNPKAPFKTSTMQQVAYKSIGFLTSKTMQIAQQLYEGVEVAGFGTQGLVSYIRTDSVRISDEAYAQANEFIKANYGDNYLPNTRNVYKDKSNAQDAHEAIRPTYVEITPELAKPSLSNDQYKLYKLIWDRFVSSQMNSAKFSTVTVEVGSNDENDLLFRTSGQKLIFDGYLRVEKETEKDGENSVLDKVLPDFELNEKIEFKEFDLEQHFTKAPPRYNDASLVNELENLGIGRPSTYAPIISTLTNRGYITRENKIIYMTELGEIVNDMMEENFPNIVDKSFTAKMEERLDRVETGEIEWKDILREFYPDFKERLDKAEEEISKVEVKDVETDTKCEKCGRNMVIKQGKYGKFLACPGFPECSNAKPYYEDTGSLCPKCGGKVYVKKTKKGRKFYGCEHNLSGDENECDFISWYKPINEKCPKCGEYLVEKGGKFPKIACSNEKCSYVTKKEDNEEEN